MALPGWRHRLQQALKFDHRVGGLRERRRRKLAAGHHLHPHTSPLHGLNQRHEVTALADDDWRTPFAMLVDPLHWLVQAVLPQMIERRSGKVVIYGSATALRGLKTVAAYSAARAAQVGYVQAVGVEVAPHNVQVNLIAQNYVENREYYPPELMQKDSFVRSLKRQVPAGRLGTAREDALFALFLASDESGFFAGQAFPFAGGWAQR